MKRTIIVLFFFALALSLTYLNHGSSAQGNTVAIKNARIVTVTGPVIEKGAVIIQGDKIADVGASVRIPSGAKEIDASGLTVYPGMINASTTMGLTEIGSVAATNDSSEIGEFNPQLKAIIAVHPESEIIPVTRVNGITTVLTAPRGGILAGQAALINLDGWTWEEMNLKNPVGIVFNFPTIYSGRSFDFATFQVRERSFEEVKRQRDETLDKVRKVFDDARAYAKAKEAKAKNPRLPDLETNLMLESLVPVVKGELPLLVNTSRERDIKAAVEFAAEQKVKIIIVGADEAHKVASLLKEKNIPVILGPVFSLPLHEDDPYDAQYTKAAALSKAGIKFAFQGVDGDGPGDASNARNLPYHAGMSVAYGLPKEEALKALTIYPAEIFGVADRVGSIEPGKLANLVITNGDLLEIRTQIRYLFIKGKQIALKTKQTELYEKYVNRP